MTTTAELVAALRSRGWTLGVAESLTGGAVASEIVSVPGASDVLLGGIVAYATEIKHTLLGVDAELLHSTGPVHPTVAAQMADGVRRAVAVDGHSADIGIATTGIAGPDSPDGQPVGTVHLAVVTPTACEVRSFVFEGSRQEIRVQARDAALRTALDVVRE